MHMCRFWVGGGDTVGACLLPVFKTYACVPPSENIKDAKDLVRKSGGARSVATCCLFLWFSSHK